MRGKNPPPKERRRPPSAAPATAELLFKLPLGGRPTLLRQGEALPELEYEIDPERGATLDRDDEGHVALRPGKPRYFYVDLRRTCETCKVSFVFSAAEQKYFFEKRLFPFYSTPIHCPTCRRLRRGTRALNDAMAEALQGLEARPDEPAALLALAAAIVGLHQETGNGDLNKAISCARKAVSQATPSQLGEAAFWEAKAQLLAGRREKAVPLFRLAFEKLPGSKRCVPLRAETAAFLAGEKEASPASPPSP